MSFPFLIILVCKGIRRVIQIDVNDNAEHSKKDQEGTGFLDKNKLEAVDHNKQFYRISLDVNFRNIDLVDVRPPEKEKKKKKLKMGGKGGKKNDSKKFSKPDGGSARMGFFNKERALEKASSHSLPGMANEGHDEDNSVNKTIVRKEKPKDQERLFMTQNKLYAKPVLSEIKEERLRVMSQNLPKRINLNQEIRRRAQGF